MTGALYAAAGSDPDRLVEVAREFSPRIEVCGPREITLDLSGLARLFGDARAIAGELRRTAADRGLQVRIAIAGTRTAARLLVRHRAGITIVEPGDEASALAPLPHDLLTGLTSGPPEVRSRGSLDPPQGTALSSGAGSSGPAEAAELAAAFRRWGLRTLGEVAALPPGDVAARLGQTGV
ncbi:MAG TPA: hypothetical protein VNN99_01820, partial [Vicinamibacterales bacterium]|nr:hypothetical protein [Vicinamibacterales bacterium]